MRALGVYCVALVNTALIASLLQVFPFDFGDVDPAWTTATRLVLGLLLLWACVRAMRSAVRLAHGRPSGPAGGGPRLARSGRTQAA